MAEWCGSRVLFCPLFVKKNPRHRLVYSERVRLSAPVRSGAHIVTGAA
jgi:hypothetical protein